MINPLPDRVILLEGDFSKDVERRMGKWACRTVAEPDGIIRSQNNIGLNYVNGVACFTDEDLAIAYADYLTRVAWHLREMSREEALAVVRDHPIATHLMLIESEKAFSSLIPDAVSVAPMHWH